MLLQTLTSKVTTSVAALAIGAAGATVAYVALDDDAPAQTQSASAPADLTAADAADAADDVAATDPTDPAAPFAGGLAGLLAQLPPELRADLQALRGLDDPAELRGALEDLRSGALSGDYGPAIEQQAEALRAQVEQWAAELPPALRSDLEGLRDLDGPEQLRDALAAIKDKALDGAYGAEVQQQAEQLTAGLESFGFGDLLD